MILKLIKEKYYVLVLSFIAVFFFLRGGQWLLSQYNQNWAYIFDQTTLPLITMVCAFLYLKHKSLLKIDWFVVTIVALVILVTHYYSLYRVVFDEWSNIFRVVIPLDRNIPFQRDDTFFLIRERYALWPFILLHEVFNLLKPGSLVLGMSGVLMTVLGSLGGAWLAWVISKSRLAALFTGLLIGISPNTFASIFAPVNVLGDNFGMIMVSLTVGIWIIARRTRDYNGILLSLLLLAASLKGGSAVRIIMLGPLIIMTDIVFFWRKVKGNYILSWLAIIFVMLVFYFSNRAVQFGVASSISNTSSGASLAVRGVQLSELVTKSFFPPRELAITTRYLLNFNLDVPNYFWITLIGVLTFCVGTFVSLYLLIKRRFPYLFWGWTWFFMAIFYVPWFAEGYGSQLNTIDSRSVFTELYPGFRYAYIPLLGVHIALGIVFSRLIAKPSKRSLALIVISIFMLFRGFEFTKFEYKWYVDMTTSNRAWQESLFKILPPGKSDVDSAVVLVDGTHNPLSGVGKESISKNVYLGNTMFYESAKEFLETWKTGKISIDNVYALGWDSGKQKEVDLSDTFRGWLGNEKSIVWTGNNFDEMNVVLPNPSGILLKANVVVQESASTSSLDEETLSISLLCNTDSKRAAKDLLWKQRTVSDWLSRSEVKVPISLVQPKQNITVPLQCEGSILKKMVFSFSSRTGARIEDVEISFPTPKYAYEEKK